MLILYHLIKQILSIHKSIKIQTQLKKFHQHHNIPQTITIKKFKK
jgi:hypothetical protein